MFLDDTYFQGELHLPNMKYSGPAVGVGSIVLTAAENNLEWFIAKYEQQFLRELLGATLADNFMGGYNQADVNPIWIDLKDAIFRVVDGYGFSPAANYVYFYVMRDSRTKTTMNGEKVSTQDYALQTSDTAKLVKAWNDMCPAIYLIRQFVFDNWNIYSSYAGCKEEICRAYFHHINTFGI